MGLFSAPQGKVRIPASRLASAVSAALKDARIVALVLIAAMAVLILVTTSLHVS